MYRGQDMWALRFYSVLRSPLSLPGFQQTSTSSSGFSCGSAGKESASSVGDLGLIPGLGRSPEEGKGHPLQYSGQEDSRDCVVHGVTKSQTGLSDFHSFLMQISKCSIGICKELLFFFCLWFKYFILKY